MKMKNLTFIALFSSIICGIGVLIFLEISNRPVIQRHSHPHQIAGPNNDRANSVSKSTTLLLLTVAVIGVLWVRRKKEDKTRPARHNRPQATSEDRNKEFVKLNKQYLNMQYKITQHKFSGENPPDCLRKEISELERKVRLIARALE
ncbi:MAG: hypothetical protein PVI82_06750 [Desulfobacterales bacterium]|jgi:hypothetical protein